MVQLPDRPLIPAYELLRLIGRGSYGDVWLARGSPGEYRAIKVIYKSRFRDLRPFERELNGVQKFEPVSRLSQGLIDILGIGHNKELGYFYCIMELADDVKTGQKIDAETYTPKTLSEAVSGYKTLPVERCIDLGIVIGAALNFLHAQGLVHRDVKPSNIVFVNGVPKLGDIGLVAETSEALSYVGTEGFIPPEGPGTVRADIYSLGKVLYEISTGKDRHDFPALPTLIGDSDIDPKLLELNKVILKACRSEARQRYRSAQELISDLALVKRGGKVRNSSHSLWRLAAAGILVCLAILTPLLWNDREGFVRQSAGSNSVPRAPTLAAPWAPAFPGAVPAPQGLVAWLRADGQGYDFARNASSQARLLRTELSPGKIGQGYTFSGNKGVIELPDAPCLRLTNELTIEFWIRRSQFDTPDFVLEKGGDWTAGLVNFGIAVNPREVNNGCLVFLFACGWRGAGSIADTNWHHCIVVAREGDTDPCIYIDGAGQPILYRGGAESIHLHDSAAPLHIGAQVDPGSGYDYYSVKELDEISIFNRALTQDEIYMLAGCASKGKFTASCPPAPLPRALRTNFDSGRGAPGGLICWWRAEGNTEDSAGTNHAITVGNVGFASGVAGTGFLFDGKGSFLRVPHSANLDLTNELTLMLWIQNHWPVRYTYGLISKRGSETASINFGLMVGPFGTSILFNDPATRGGENALSRFENSYAPFWPEHLQWCHLAATLRQTEEEKTESKVFVNGRLAHASVLGGDLANSANEFPVTIGANMEYPTYDYFEGIIDDVRIYNRALTEVEVAALYRLFAPGEVSQKKADSKGR